MIQTALTPPGELGLPFGSWTLDRLVAYLTEVKGIPIKRSRISEISGMRGCVGVIRKGGSESELTPTSRKKGGYRNPLHSSPSQQCSSLHG